MERLRNLNAGLGQYCLHLGRALAALPAAKEAHFECYLPKPMGGILGASFGYRSVRKWQKLTGVATDANLWHCTHQDSAYFPVHKETAVAMTIHDLNFLERSDYSNWRKKVKTRRLQQKINRCKGLVYISEFVKNTVHAHLTIPAGTTEKVIYNGVALGIPTANTAEQRNQPYLFSIGLHPKKNYLAGLPILKTNPAYQWVIAGADDKGYRGELEKAAADLGVSHQLEFTGAVTEEAKWKLYQDCSAFVFPSLAEGFGLPVLEAMAFGKPVFLSDRTSLPEIGGQEAFYFKNFEPGHVQQVFEAGMQHMLQDPEKPERMKTYAARFTWDKAAKEYLSLYQTILNN
jgi:glycosyltransferase involved in cell wall biosynthesis